MGWGWVVVDGVVKGWRLGASEWREDYKFELLFMKLIFVLSLEKLFF